jgi:hypothetical protein
MRFTFIAFPTTRSPFGANTTPSYGPASIGSSEVHTVAPLVSSSAYTTCDTDAPLPERDAYTRPSRAPRIHVVQSPATYGTCRNHSSAPVSRSWHTTGDPFGSPPGGKPVCRTRKTRRSAITGCHAMIDERPPFHSGSAASGPTSDESPLRRAFPPLLLQPWALAAGARVAARTRSAYGRRAACRGGMRRFYSAPAGRGASTRAPPSATPFPSGNRARTLDYG